MSVLFILNPAAGHGRAPGYWKRVEPGLRELFPGHRARQTRGPGHAAELVAEGLREGVTRFFAVGGDGTLHEAAQGLLEAGCLGEGGPAALGLLPAGSGCDFARHFGVPADPDLCLPRLARARPRAIDAAHARFQGLDGRPRAAYFLNIAAFGLAGDVAEAMLASGKPLGGTVSYLTASIGAIWNARPKALTLELDGVRREGAYHLAGVANTATTGGGMRLAPEADAADGLLDWVAVGPLSRGRLLWNLPKVYRGAHLAVEGVESAKVRRLEAGSDERVLINLDGELAGMLPALFEVRPGVLPVLLP